MRRVWLVAVFALSLFFGTGAFAYGLAASPGASPVALHSATADAVSDLTIVEDGTTGSAAPQSDTGPNERLADMPECLDVAIAHALRGALLYPPSPPLAQDLTPPVLDGPQRPPRDLFLSVA